MSITRSSGAVPSPTGPQLLSSNRAHELASDLARPRGQASAIVIGEAQTAVPSWRRRSRLFDQIRDRLPLPALQPASEHAQRHLQRGGSITSRSFYHGQARDTSAELWNTTGVGTRPHHLKYGGRHVTAKR